MVMLPAGKPAPLRISRAMSKNQCASVDPVFDATSTAELTLQRRGTHQQLDGLHPSPAMAPVLTSAQPGSGCFPSQRDVQQRRVGTPRKGRVKRLCKSARLTGTPKGLISAMPRCERN
jgi:hypothetical protein